MRYTIPYVIAYLVSLIGFSWYGTGQPLDVQWFCVVTMSVVCGFIAWLGQRRWKRWMAAP